MDKLSAILQYQLPDFVRDDHEVFVAFVQAYYEWLEAEGNVLNFIENVKTNMNVDLADDDWLEAYVTEFAQTIPKNNLVSKNVLIKAIRDFYISKGSESSFKFIFTLLYNVDIELIYPRDFLHIPSDGEYTSEDYIYITGTHWDELVIDNSDLNAQIEGVLSGSTAVIDSIISTFYKTERTLKLNLSSNSGLFSQGEDVTLTIDSKSVTETAYPIINSIVVTDGGKGYKVTDEISITGGDGTGCVAVIDRVSKGAYTSVTLNDGGLDYEVGDLIYAVNTVTSKGYSFLAQVTGVDGSGTITGIRILNNGRGYSEATIATVKSENGTGADIDLDGDDVGKILAIEVVDPGIDYTNPSGIVVSVTSATGSGATLTPSVEVIFNERKTYKTQDGFTDSYNRVHDSYYYQQYSYVIKAPVSPHLWLDTVKRLAHPAGSQVFGMYQLESEFDISIGLESGFGFAQVVELLNEINTSYTTYDSTSITLMYEQLGICPIDQTTGDLDYMKFDADFDWPVSYFYDLSIDDVVNPCYEPMKYTTDSTFSTD